MGIRDVLGLSKRHPPSESIGQLFRTARVCAGLSLREVAARLGVDDVTLGEYERGVKEPPLWRPLFEKLTPLTTFERNDVIDHLLGHARGFRASGQLTEARLLEEKADQIKRGEHSRYHVSYRR